jgi:hypothetical protein
MMALVIVDINVMFYFKFKVLTFKACAIKHARHVGDDAHVPRYKMVGHVCDTACVPCRQIMIEIAHMCEHGGHVGNTLRVPRQQKLVKTAHTPKHTGPGTR